MAKKELMKLFNRESFAGGGSFFTAGLYKVLQARFVLYDFNGKAKGKNGDGLPCLSLKLQPVGGDGADAGDPVVQYWSVGNDIDFSIEEKGHSLASIGQYPTIWTLSDYGIFVDKLGKAGFDMDAFEDENDIAILEDKVMEFGLILHPRDENKPKGGDDDEKKGDKKKVNHIVVVTEANPKGSRSSKSSKPDKSDEKEETKSDSKSGKGGKSDEDLLIDYLTKKVLTEDNAGGIEKVQARMGLGAYLQKEHKVDADRAKAVAKLFNNDSKLNAILESAGWEINGSTIKKED